MACWPRHQRTTAGRAGAEPRSAAAQDRGGYRCAAAGLEWSAAQRRAADRGKARHLCLHRGTDRPHCRSRVQSVFLAGDWLCPDYPATLEGAVQSGVTAARQLLQDLSSSRVTAG
ncbi:FAD-dependent oxidoreductase [Aquitalea magnusonii]|uniref:FAD-dependent oxidoreductase n=1 Tax=Aquitalea magnusonii TaxID=332411 RepID=UPI00128EB53E